MSSTTKLSKPAASSTPLTKRRTAGKQHPSRTGSYGSKKRPCSPASSAAGNSSRPGWSTTRGFAYKDRGQKCKVHNFLGVRPHRLCLRLHLQRVDRTRLSASSLQDVLAAHGPSDPSFCRRTRRSAAQQRLQRRPGRSTAGPWAPQEDLGKEVCGSGVLHLLLRQLPPFPGGAGP